MRIVTRKQFMKLPIGTVFSYYEPCVFRDLLIKVSDDKQWPTDFLYDDLIGAVKNKGSDDFSEKCRRMELGESLPVDFEYTGREGLFEDEQLFAVYEKDDVEQLIKRLQNTLL